MIILNNKKYYKIQNTDVEDYYYISKDGEVISTFWKQPKILSTRKDKDGYLDLGMVKQSGKRSPMRIHRLVAKTFIPNPNNYPVTNHKNGIVDDNRIENLEWCTISYNTQHAYDELGVITGRQKVIRATNLKSDCEFIFQSINDTADFFNSHSATISRKLSGENNNPSKYGNLKDIYFECLGYTNVTTIENFTKVKSE